ncbi:MAG: efflux RND transporter permease subunit, partial [Bacteroidales bacterium]|nr:efflux RND transporter permease subunit [Bacteroidales bacterium]
MSIYKSSVNNPITTLMIFVALIVMGIYSLVYIPIDLYPEMEPPFISVVTTYPGANASEIETNVSRPLEDAFNTVDNLKEITSVSSDNISVVSLEFEWESDLNEATNDVRDAIDRIYDFLPDGVDRPTIFKFNMSMIPVIFYAITAEESYPGLARILEEKIINPLNRIEGIGSVNLAGAQERRIYIETDPVKLDAYKLSIEQIGNIISAENMNMPSGNIKMGKMDYQLRIEGEFEESNELNNLVLG